VRGGGRGVGVPAGEEETCENGGPRDTPPRRSGRPSGPGPRIPVLHSPAQAAFRPLGPGNAGRCRSRSISGAKGPTDRPRTHPAPGRNDPARPFSREPAAAACADPCSHAGRRLLGPRGPRSWCTPPGNGSPRAWRVPGGRCPGWNARPPAVGRVPVTAAGSPTDSVSRQPPATAGSGSTGRAAPRAPCPWAVSRCASGPRPSARSCCCREADGPLSPGHPGARPAADGLRLRRPAARGRLSPPNGAVCIVKLQGTVWSARESRRSDRSRADGFGEDRRSVGPPGHTR